MDELLKIKPREYQQKIFENCRDKNCLVVLPTGVGKTLIALMLAIHVLKTQKGKVLFLAPTRPLAEQHLVYFKKHLPELFAELTLFTGKTQSKEREKLYSRADIIFSTPQCIQNDVKNQIYTIEDVTLLIIDESHRSLKNYAYTYIARTYQQQAKNKRVLGLTASPGTDRKTIEQIAKNLSIETVEMRTRDSDDVKPYLQDLEFKTIPLEFPAAFKEIVDIIKTIQQRKIQELRNRKVLFGPANKTQILQLQAKLMGQISSGSKNFNLFSAVSATSQAIKLAHLIELLETQSLYSANIYIKSMFDQAAQEKSKAVQQIIKNPDFNRAYLKINELIAKNIEHPKLLELKSIAQELIQKNKKNKIIVFSQYRDTVIKINQELNKIPDIISKVFVGQAKKIDSGLSQKEQQVIMEEFKRGEINAIAATSIAEEGLDIPEVNAVIFYEPIPSAIRKIQRAGRTARLMKGELIILLTKDTLDEIFYYTARSREKRMYKVIQDIQKDVNEGKPLYKELKEEEEEKQKRLF